MSIPATGATFEFSVGEVAIAEPYGVFEFLNYGTQDVTLTIQSDCSQQLSTLVVPADAVATLTLPCDYRRFAARSSRTNAVLFVSAAAQSAEDADTPDAALPPNCTIAYGMRVPLSPTYVLPADAGRVEYLVEVTNMLDTIQGLRPCPVSIVPGIHELFDFPVLSIPDIRLAAEFPVYFRADRPDLRERVDFEVRGPTNTLPFTIEALTATACPDHFSTATCQTVPADRGFTVRLWDEPGQTLIAVASPDGGPGPARALTELRGFGTMTYFGASADDVAVDRQGRVWLVRNDSLCQVALENGMVRNCVVVAPGEHLQGAAGLSDSELVVGGNGLFRVGFDAGFPVTTVLVDAGVFRVSGDVETLHSSVFLTATGLHSDELWRFDLDGGGVHRVGELGFSGAAGLFREGDRLFVLTSGGRTVEIDPVSAAVISDTFSSNQWKGAATRPE